MPSVTQRGVRDPIVDPDVVAAADEVIASTTGTASCSSSSGSPYAR
jgi:hypothetical protein